MEKFEAPIPEQICKELMSFWDSIFESPRDVPIDAYLGAELEYNSHIVFLERRFRKLVGTCHLTVSQQLPFIGGLGEVATSPDHRGLGFGTRLCKRALGDFQRLGGRALFLGTGNDLAAQIYQKLGWQKLNNTNVMANITGPKTPEGFLESYSQVKMPISVGVATEATRIPMILLLVTPHEWHVLDSNTGMYSTRYYSQRSCMGLYRKYNAVRYNSGGEWFSAVGEDGRVLGLMTACLDLMGGCRVDGFNYSGYPHVLEELILAAVMWAKCSGASPIWASILPVDVGKREIFEVMGFHEKGSGPLIDLDGHLTQSRRFEMR